MTPLDGVHPSVSALEYGILAGLAGKWYCPYSVELHPADAAEWADGRRIGAALVGLLAGVEDDLSGALLAETQREWEESR